MMQAAPGTCVAGPAEAARKTTLYVSAPARKTTLYVSTPG